MKRKYEEISILEPPSLQDHLDQFYVWRKYQYEFPEFAEPLLLNRPYQLFQQFLSDIGQAVYDRMENGQEVGHLTTENIKIIDGVATLPPPPKRHLDCLCHCHCRENCFCHPIGELLEIYDTVLSYDGLVDSAERDNLITLVQEVAYKKNPLSFLKDLFLHFLFQSAEAKLVFIGNAMDYLIDHEDEIMVKLGRTWQESYSHFSDGRFDIEQSIQGNLYLESVYYYHSDLKVADPNNPQPYRNSCTGLLHFLTNLIKHVNEHRRRDGMSKWQAEEKEVVIEKYFPGEMNHIFEFFWCRGLKLDFTRHLRTHAPIYK